MRRKGLTFPAWLDGRKRDNSFEKFLRELSEQHGLKNYRDFICFFYDTYRNSPAYFDKSSPMYEAVFQDGLNRFTELFEEFERCRRHKNPFA